MNSHHRGDSQRSSLSAHSTKPHSKFRFKVFASVIGGLDADVRWKSTRASFAGRKEELEKKALREQFCFVGHDF